MKIQDDERAEEYLAIQTKKTTLEQQTLNLRSAMGAAKNNATTMELMITRWASKGTADSTVADYFSAYGVEVGDNIASYEDQVQEWEYELEEQAIYIAGLAESIGQADEAMGFLDSYLIDADTSAEPGMSKESSNVTMEQNYRSYLNGAMTKPGGDPIDSAYIGSKIKTLITGRGDSKSGYEVSMGAYYYNKLLSDLTEIQLKLAMTGATTE
jgi:hypothetical protein